MRSPPDPPRTFLGNLAVGLARNAELFTKGAAVAQRGAAVEAALANGNCGRCGAVKATVAIAANGKPVLCEACAQMGAAAAGAATKKIAQEAGIAGKGSLLGAFLSGFGGDTED